jgi:hypothetical protein
MIGSGEDLVTASVIFDLGGLRGSISPGVGEVVALMKGWLLADITLFGGEKKTQLLSIK